MGISNRIKQVTRSTIQQVQWVIKKRKILRDAKLLLSEDISLDVIKRFDTFIFFNKGNSLIKRGESYEPEVQKMLSTLVSIDKIRNKKTIVADIGSNIGLHTFFVSKHIGLPVVAFDPSPYSWKYLELSIKYNEVQNVRLEKVALSDHEGIIDFFNWGEESSADSIKDTGRVNGIKPALIKVEARKIDNYSDLPDMTVWKMDCEGAELTILKGAKNTILRIQPLIVLEFHPVNKKAFDVTDENIFDLLAELKYSICDLNFNKLTLMQFKELQKNYEENYLILPDNLFNQK